jgi:hypothetical protein
MRIALTLGLLAMLAVPAVAHADVVYSSIPSALPPNVPSIGFEATSTSLFGDAVALSGTARLLTGASVLMSNWALESTYEQVGTSTGYFAPLTLSFYSFGAAGPNPTVGSVIATETVNAFIPWRPEATPRSCTQGGYLAGDGHCYSGIDSLVTFSFGGVSLPDDVIFGLSFNTQTFGVAPTHTAGPINSLNLGFSTGALVGTDVNPDGVELNTADGTFLTTGAAGVFGPDTGWAGFVPGVTISAIVPEPASLLLLAQVALVLTGGRRRIVLRG